MLRPEMLWFVPVVAATGWALWRVARRSAGWIPRWFGRLRHHRPMTVWALRTAALALVYLALLGFRGPAGIERLPARGRQIYFVIDVSASMNVADVAPSRLEKVRLELRTLIQALKGEQMGLVVYTNFAYTLCPLTTDLATLELYLDMVGSGQFAARGSELRPALYEVIRRYQEQDDKLDDRFDQARAVVLFTDGEDHGGKYAASMALLRDQGAVVIPVLVGTRAGGLVPNLDANGKPSGVMNDPAGGVARSRVEDEGLRKIADAFDQPLLRLDEDGATLRPLLAQLRSLPAAALPGQGADVPADSYPLFLFPAVVMLSISLFLRTRRD